MKRVKEVGERERERIKDAVCDHISRECEIRVYVCVLGLIVFPGVNSDTIKLTELFY